MRLINRALKTKLWAKINPFSLRVNYFRHSVMVVGSRLTHKTHYMHTHTHNILKCGDVAQWLEHLSCLSQAPSLFPTTIKKRKNIEYICFHYFNGSLEYQVDRNVFKYLFLFVCSCMCMHATYVWVPEKARRGPEFP